MAFMNDILWEIELLSYAENIVMRHNENLQDMIHDLSHDVKFLIDEASMENAMKKEFESALEAMMPYLVKQIHLLDKYAAALRAECERLDKMLPPLAIAP